MLVRDPSNIVVQHDPSVPSYADGGDSARSTGILALVGSTVDRINIARFFMGRGLLVRHPYQPIHDDSRNFTRDQLLPLTAGMWAAGNHTIVRRVFIAQAKRFFLCQNTHTHPDGVLKKFPNGPDILHPGHIWHLILCAKLRYLYWLAPIGYLFQLFDLLWSTKVKPDEEQNQVFCMMVVSGLLPLYLKLHPDFEKNMRYYWCGWRDQRDIYNMIMEFVNGQ